MVSRCTPLTLSPPLTPSRGFQSVIEDYVPGPLRGLCYVLLYLVTTGTFCGLMYLNVKDVGICTAVKMIWSI